MQWLLKHNGSRCYTAKTLVERGYLDYESDVSKVMWGNNDS